MIFSYEAEFNSSFENTDSEVKKIMTAVEQIWIVDKDLRFKMDFMLRELINNAIEHGNEMDVGKKVKVRFEIAEENITVDVFDEGIGYDLYGFLDASESLEPLRTRQRGLLMIMEMGYRLDAKSGHVRCTGKISVKQMKKRSRESMEITVQGRIATCRVNSNIVASNVKGFSEEIKLVLEDRDDLDEIVIDLSNTESIDSMGITFLIALQKNQVAKNRVVKVTGVSEPMLKIFKMLKLVDIFKIGA